MKTTLKAATLTLGGRFDTVARSLGLPAPAVPAARSAAEAPATSGDGWTSLDVGSPFDYPKQGILYVAAHLPRPAMSGLPDAAGEELLTAAARPDRVVVDGHLGVGLLEAGLPGGLRRLLGDGPAEGQP